MIILSQNKKCLVDTTGNTSITVTMIPGNQYALKLRTGEHLGIYDTEEDAVSVLRDIAYEDGAFEL